MKTALKYLSVDLAVMLGNTFLSCFMLWLWQILIYLLRKINMGFDTMQHIVLLFVCVLQISINILLYKTLLKKFFEPSERKNLLLYLLLPIAIVVLWVGMFWLLFFVNYPIDFYHMDFYQAPIVFLPLVLLTLLPPLIVYRLGLKKRVGEAYCIYMLGIFGVLISPLTFVYIGVGMG